MESQCPVCGRNNPAGSWSCEFCGSPLTIPKSQPRPTAPVDNFGVPPQPVAGPPIRQLNCNSCCLGCLLLVFALVAVPIGCYRAIESSVSGASTTVQSSR